MKGNNSYIRISISLKNDDTLLKCVRIVTTCIGCFEALERKNNPTTNHLHILEFYNPENIRDSKPTNCKKRKFMN